MVFQTETTGFIPGYMGYIPAMKTHVHGQRYTEATNKALIANQLMSEGENPSSHPEFVDSRPQGRDFLYAQVAKPGMSTQSVKIPISLSKTTAAPAGSSSLLGDAKSAKPKVYSTRTVETASLSALPYHKKEFITRKLPKEELPSQAKDPSSNLPGYTGHQHGAQHVYGRSYGSTTKMLKDDNSQADHRTTLNKTESLMDYSDDRPQGLPLQDNHKIPGYTGCIVAKDNHIYGKTFGQSTKLAELAVTTLKQGGNVSELAELTDQRPQGRIDLYTQKVFRPKENLTVAQLTKPVTRPITHELTKEYKIREKVTQEMFEVNEGRHKVVGYTGHIPGQQHIYAQSYGRMTGNTLGPTQDHKFSKSLLYFKDARPQGAGRG